MKKRKLYEIILKLEKRVKSLEINRIKVQFSNPSSTKREYNERDWEQINRSIDDLKKAVRW